VNTQQTQPTQKEKEERKGAGEKMRESKTREEKYFVGMNGLKEAVNDSRIGRHIHTRDYLEINRA
jgi:hypothetical protein